MNADDVREIVRWCWPAAFAPGATEADHFEKDRSIGCQMDSDLAAVHAAELVLIERGLEWEYSRALTDELGLAAGGTGTNPAKYAMAPLDARVRAMLGAIRARQAAKTEQA